MNKQNGVVGKGSHTTYQTSNVYVILLLLLLTIPGRESSPRGDKILFIDHGLQYGTDECTRCIWPSVLFAFSAGCTKP